FNRAQKVHFGFKVNGRYKNQVDQKNNPEYPDCQLKYGYGDRIGYGDRDGAVGRNWHYPPVYDD
ncbi:MAG: hypothetical protein UR94_C0011G0029, partial [Parcubacteria group bacterium GW2011_GWA2_36_10]